MTSRERVLLSLQHREPDRVPVCLAYEEPRALAESCGQPYDAALMRQDIYSVDWDFNDPDPAIRARYLRGIPPEATVDSWGVARWYSPTGESYDVRGPLEGMTDTSELDGFPFPDIPGETVPAALAAHVERLHRDGFAVQGALSQTIFELAWNLYGMENLMIAFHDNPGFAHRLFDEITVRKERMARCYAQAGVDILRLGDDVGSQHGMMIGPAEWRTFLKPRLASVIAAAREVRPDLPVFYHSDGDVREIIDELIEVGVTILNPIQPECMDPFEIKARYGDRLTLWGTVGTQTTLPRGTPAEVRNVVREYMRRLAPGGGYVIGPSHSVNRDVPWENIVAFYEAVRDYGEYGRLGGRKEA
jgi:uroporphyrinogen decarboxylase